MDKHTSLCERFKIKADKNLAGEAEATVKQVFVTTTTCDILKWLADEGVVSDPVKLRAKLVLVQSKIRAKSLLPDKFNPFVLSSYKLGLKMEL